MNNQLKKIVYTDQFMKDEKRIRDKQKEHISAQRKREKAMKSILIVDYLPDYPLRSTQILVPKNASKDLILRRCQIKMDAYDDLNLKPKW
jgi:hypothetical protein